MVVKIKKKRRVNKPLIAVIIVLAVLVSVFAATTVIVAVNMDDNFGRGDYPDTRLTLDLLYDHYSDERPREEVSFKSGDNTLKGFIYGSDNDKALLVFAHGLGNVHEGYLKELFWFVDHGWRVFAYDATGSGYSEGEGTRGLPQSALDLDAALTFAESDPRLNDLPVFLMGHSWGGYAVTAVLNFDHEIKGVASVAGYAEPVEMIYEFSRAVVGDARPLLYPSIWLYNKLRFGKYSGLSAVDGINKSNVPVLIFHGTNDQTVSYTESAIINHRSEITNPNARFIALEDISHRGMFDTEEAREYRDEFSKKRNALYDQFGGDIPEDELIKLYADADRETMNVPNEELLSQIEKFFNENL